MKIQCGWCKRWIGEKAPIQDRSVTHSICQACQTQLLAQYGIGAKHDAA